MAISLTGRERQNNTRCCGANTSKPARVIRTPRCKGVTAQDLEDAIELSDLNRLKSACDSADNLRNGCPKKRFYMSEKIVHVTDDSFEADVLKSDKPVLLDYWAEWCGPCKMIAPLLEDIADDYADALKVAKLNIDENPLTPPKYGIRGIPTLMIFREGNVEAIKVGALSKSQLSAFIDSHI